MANRKRGVLITIALLGLLLALGSMTCWGQSWTRREYPQKGLQGYKSILPGTLTTAIAGTIYLQTIVLVNNSSSAVTVRVRDISTDCAGGACQLVPDDMSIAAKTVYSMPYYGVRAEGVQWTSSDSTNVIGRIMAYN